jgi:DNA-directed RNA polymerase subunit M/transcription elongation factor TFIIS
MDGKSRRPRVSIVISPEAMKVDGDSLAVLADRQEAPPAPVRATSRTVRGVLGTCACGTSFPVDEEELTSVQACPSCGVAYHVVVKLDYASKKRTAILVPVKTVPVRRQSIVAPSPAAKPERRTQAIGRGRTGASSAPKTQIPPGTQTVECSCGQVLLVRKADVARGMDCLKCGRALRFQEKADPQTLVPRIRIRPEPGP